MKNIISIAALSLFAFNVCAKDSGNAATRQSPIAKVSEFDLKSAKNGTAPKIMLNSGYEMPILGLGTYSLRGETCKAAVLSALSQGVRLIDTAYMYGNEKEVGEAIREFVEKSGVPRDDIFVITKIYPGEQFANPEKAIQDALDALNVGHIDMIFAPPSRRERREGVQGDREIHRKRKSPLGRPFELVRRRD